MRALLALAVALVACGGDEAAPSAGPSEPTRGETSTPTPGPGPRAPTPAPEAPLPPPRPDLDAGEDDLEDEPVGLGLTVGDIREATAVLAERAESAGTSGGLPLLACHRLEERGIVTRCANLGAMGTTIARASFELPAPTMGRGVIQAYADEASYGVAARGFEGFHREFGTFVVVNARARVVFSGAEQLDPEGRRAVEEIVGAL